MAFGLLCMKRYRCTSVYRASGTSVASGASGFEVLRESKDDGEGDGEGESGGEICESEGGSEDARGRIRHAPQTASPTEVLRMSATMRPYSPYTSQYWSVPCPSLEGGGSGGKLTMTSLRRCQC
jgi:hypothetical protein